MPLQVAVCGPSDATLEEIAQAAEIGRLLAERGAVVICGGYGGVMGAVAEGAAGGSWGTLSEIALAVRRGAARVISLNGWRVLDPDGTVVPGIHYASSPQAAVDAALN
jgi:predicted Rossmann-fold nucleotide-binding protein